MTELLAGPALADRAALALAVPLQSALGARLLEADDPAAGVVFPVVGLAVNGAGGLHAGALSGVLELACYLALLPQLSADEHALTHAVAAQLIAGAEEGEDVVVTGELDRRTRRLAFLSATASAAGRTVARAQVTKSVVAIS